MEEEGKEPEIIKEPNEPLIENDLVIQIEDQRKTFREKALKAYSFGTQKAEKGIISSSPARLGLALNFAVFQADVMQDIDEAIKIASRAVNVAMKKLDHLEDENDRQDADTIIELINENLKDWEDELQFANKSSVQEENDGQPTQNPPKIE